MHEHTRAMSSKQRIDLEMLSPCAALYYPATENITAKMALTENKANA